MRNFIGNLLIGIAGIIKFMHTTLLFLLTIGIVMGVLMITMIGLFELIGYLSPNPEYQIMVLGKWYWSLTAVVLGGSTMWLGFSKLLKGDKEHQKPANNKYIY